MSRQGTPRRIARAALAAIIAVPLTAVVLGSGLARHALQAGRPEEALKLDPLFAEAGTLLASQRLDRGDPDGAERLALHSIGRSPQNPDAAAVLGYARGVRRGPDAAAPFMALSSGMAWGNETAQLWMLNRAVEARRLDEAVVRTDALLRQRSHREELFRFLRGLTRSPAALAPLARRLAARPKWRSDYLVTLIGMTPFDLESHWWLLDAMQRTSAPATSAEIDAYLSRLVADGYFEAARVAFLTFSGRAAGAQPVTDGDFSALREAGERSPFDWSIHPVPGLSANAETAPKPALHLTSEARPSGLALSQLVVLAPGAYLLTMEAREEQPGSLRSLHAELACTGGDGIVQLGPTSLSPAGNGWQRISRTIGVPASACPAQRLQLRIDHDNPRDLDLRLRAVRISRSD